MVSLRYDEKHNYNISIHSSGADTYLGQGWEALSEKSSRVFAKNIIRKMSTSSSIAVSFMGMTIFTTLMAVMFTFHSPNLMWGTWRQEKIKTVKNILKRIKPSYRLPGKSSHPIPPFCFRGTPRATHGTDRAKISTTMYRPSFPYEHCSGLAETQAALGGGVVCHVP